jgi:hypothetical protein
MTEQHFTAILKGTDPLTDEIVERLYGRCDDVTAGIRNGIGHVHFHRPAPSLNDAIASALADLRACGLEVERIEIEAEDLNEMVSATAS